MVNGDIETSIVVHTKLPQRVAALAGRHCSAVRCTAQGTFAVASTYKRGGGSCAVLQLTKRQRVAHITAVTVDRVGPANGYTSGGTRLSFWGQGLSSLVAPGGRAVAPGQPLPGIVVKFTRHAREPSVEIEDEDNESIDSAYLRELEELVHTADGLDHVCAHSLRSAFLCIVAALHHSPPDLLHERAGASGGL